MPYIIGVNPVVGKRKKRKPTAKKRKPATRKAMAKRKKNPVAKKTAAIKRGKIMARRKKARKAPTTVTRRPSRRRSPSRRAAYRVSSNSGSDTLEIRKIIRGSVAAAAGMLIAKVAVNKLTPGGSETERWSWPNIAMAAGSSIAVAFALGAIFKLKKPTVAMIAVGGGALAAYKLFTTKLAPKWGWSESWFGADENAIHPDFLGAGADEFEVVDYSASMPADQSVGYIPGVGATNAGGKVVPYNPNMGATNAGGKVVPYNPNMGFDGSNDGASARAIRAYGGYTM